MQFPINLTITHMTQIQALKAALECRYDFLNDTLFEDIEQRDGVGQNVNMKSLDDKVTYCQALLPIIERTNNVNAPGRYRINDALQLEHIVAASESFIDMETDMLYEAIPTIQDLAHEVSVNRKETEQSRNTIDIGSKRVTGLSFLLGQLTVIKQTLVIPESDS